METTMYTNAKPKKGKSKIFLFLIFIITLLIGIYIGGTFKDSRALSFFFTKFNPSSILPKTSGSNSDLSGNLDLRNFWRVLDLIEEHYIDAGSLDADKLVYGAIGGMIDSLGDPYTSFFSPDENTDFKEGLDGTYEGIGAQLGFKDSNLVIVAPLSDSPAEKAGLKAGDIIVAVDGESVAGWSIEKAVDAIRGESGTTVTLLLSDREVPVVRKEITIPAVRLTWQDSNEIAVIRILRFGTDTDKEWDDAMSAVASANAKGLIVDLRNNPGGFLNSAIYLASDFFDSGVVVKKQTNSGVEPFTVSRKCRVCDLPVVVLVNEGSASASEILAGALQKRGRAELVGKTSFGKGTVQEAIDLPDGSAVHITTARWLLPNDQNIHEVGLTPEYEIDATQTTGVFEDNSSNDAQMQKALELLRDKIIL